MTFKLGKKKRFTVIKNGKERNVYGHSILPGNHLPLRAFIYKDFLWIAAEHYTGKTFFLGTNTPEECLNLAVKVLQDITPEKLQECQQLIEDTPKLNK